LVIPALHVDASIVEAPVAASGALTVPTDRNKVGWWTGGAQPGAPTGTVVLAGHVDDRGGPGALFRLAELPVGAAVYVDGDSRRYGYRAMARRSYLKQRLPASIFDRAVGHRLVLITCGGAFHDGHYAGNLVVYADPA
jgi:sortase (surface protein transpeptidase)